MKNTLKSELIVAAVRLAAVREALEIIVASGDDRECGRRALLLAHIIDPKLTGNQSALARRMGVSRARTSQMCQVLRRQMARLGRQD